MTSRKRKNYSTSNTDASRSDQRSSSKSSTRKKRRRHILETLEARQLLAGPQLIGIQPNEGDLIVNGSVLDTAPRLVTLRFDEVQEIDPGTFDGIRVTRAGDDGQLGTFDDVEIVPGLVTSGNPDQNEVVVRFSDTLPNDRYKLEVFGFDDDVLGITGLRNENGELFQPQGAGQRVQVTEFELRLGAMIESVVPQPVIRLADGSLVQNRNEIVVYFNEDPLFAEDGSATATVTDAGEELTIRGIVSERTFTDTSVLFDVSASASAATAVHDATANTITVTYPSVANFQSIALAITALDGFEAEVTAGSPNAIFVAPTTATVIKGTPTARSVENTRFYQLLLTNETVRTTDDALYHPNEVIYDPNTHTARLFFTSNADGSPIDDINQLGPDADGNAGVPLGGGTFRLRIGTAVDDRMDIILPPLQRSISPSTTTDFGIDGFAITFTSLDTGEAASGRQVRFENTGAGGLSARVEPDDSVVFDFGGDSPTVGQLQVAAAGTSAILINFSQDGVAGAGAATAVPTRVIGAPPLVLVAVGDTLNTALDVGVFGQGGELTSLVLSESIDAMPVAIELPGGNDDPGHRDFGAIAPDVLIKHINDNFGADSTDSTLR